MRVDSKVATEVQALLPLLVVFAVFYAFLIRPQQKQQKRHREMLGRLKKGDRVLTRGGLYGVVMEVKDNDLMLELAQNVRVRADRSAVQALVKRGSAGG
ncbi:MAG: preprotein translocase subunit YajC [Bacillati bacterium ANGP1]|uniref:Preprotein translocase subunit YajC n=1 Tax=Candidatus Segetimicrobium genomatis TaxID=2569760 RepID=A0A537JNC3_9BACT|nr:MAG: preprotein translocase subunit YajC [Terrabacteria group bacterium ANGP1]